MKFQGFRFCGLRRIFLHCALGCGVLPGLLAAKVKWEPVSQADRESKQCANFPGVAAEELFKYQTLDADNSQAWNEYYLRRKIYNAKAAQDSGLLNIEYEGAHSLFGLAARVIKSDGTFVELDKKDFVDAVVAKYKGFKIKAKSVAVPNLEAGDIVEYQWSEPTDQSVYQPQTWFIQSVYPTRRYTFTLRRTKSDCNVLWFNVANAQASLVDGKQVLTVTDIPPYQSEPFTPPERDIRGAVVIINTGRWARWWGKEGLWKDLSSEWAENFRLETKPTSEIKRLAKEIVADAKTDDEKLTRLYNYVRSTVLNLSYYDDADLQKARKKLEDGEGKQLPAATLKAKSGYPFHVNQLFASLCAAAGYEVRSNWSASRNDTTNIQSPQGFVFLNYQLIAVKVGSDWRYFAPGDHFVGPGLLDWQYENAPGLLCEEDPKAVTYVTPVPAPAAASEEFRKGVFSLNAEGDCEGMVTVSYTGHCATAKKRDWAGKTVVEIEKLMRDEIATTQPTAELAEFHFENTGGASEPVVVTYQMKVAGYAEAAGERLIFAPAVFQKGVSPVLKNSSRKWPVSFNYAWHSRDEITLKIPADYELDSPTAPQSFGKPEDPFRSVYKISFRKKEHALIYARDVVIADKGVVAVPASAYLAIKQIFDAVIKSDAHTLVIKPKGVVAAGPVPATPAQPETAPKS